jgi:hypothetical protein
LIENYGFQEETYLLLVRIGVQFSGGKVCSFQAEKTPIGSSTTLVELPLARGESAMDPGCSVLGQN